MNCESYLRLIENNESAEFIASLLHSVMQDEKGFEDACKIINRAKKRGIFKNVVFFPKPENEPIYPIETTSIA